MPDADDNTDHAAEAGRRTDHAAEAGHRTEVTGPLAASLAGRILNGGYTPTKNELLIMAGSLLTQAADKGGETKGLPVKGYKATQPAWAIEAVDVFKEQEERALRAVDALAGQAIDHRFMAIGRTQLQIAFMAINRAVFQPQRVPLPEDGHGLFDAEATYGSEQAQRRATGKA